MLDSFKKNIKSRWQRSFEDKEKQPAARKKAVIIVVVVILAFMLWLVVNLNRDYTVNIDIPIVLGQVSSNQALAEELPEKVTAGISGEGWKLLEVYRDPPPIFIEVSGQQINLFEQVRRQIQAGSNLTVQTVDPLYLQIQLEERVSKKVPVIARIATAFAAQFGFLEEPSLQPDSVMVTGARSVVEDISYWVTDSASVENIKEDIFLQIPLKEAGPLVRLSEQNVMLQAEVAQFTEGVVTVPVELRNLRPGRNVIFSPQQVEIRYLAPLEEFPELDEGNIFTAGVTYTQLMQDTTGFIQPQITQLVDNVHLKVQQVRPPQVAYFNIVTSGQ